MNLRDKIYNTNKIVRFQTPQREYYNTYKRLYNRLKSGKINRKEFEKEKTIALREKREKLSEIRRREKGY